MATWVERALDDNVIASVSFGKVTTGTMAVGQVLTLGDPDGTHMELSQSPALRVKRPNPDGELQDTIVLGGVDRDVVQIIDTGSGSTLAGLFDDGQVTGLAGTFDQLSTRGQKLGDLYDPDDILWALPRGVIAAYRQTVNSSTATTSPLGVCEVSGQVQGGRTYRVTWTGDLTPSIASGQTVRVALGYTLDGTAPTAAYATNKPWHLFRTFRLTSIERQTYSVSALFTPSDDPALWYTYRGLAILYSGTSGQTVYSQASGGALPAPIDMTLEDVGPARGFGAGQPSAGGGTPSGGTPVPPPVTGKQQVTRTFPASWVRSWDADGTVRTGSPDGYQGYWTASRGIQRSQIGFPATSAIGRDVVRIRVRLCFHHWAGSSGTAVIGVHGNPSLPGSFSYSGQLMSSSWARNEYRWVTLPETWYPAFESGVNRGITLGGGLTSTASQYYGRVSGYAATNRPILEVTTLE